MRILIFPSSYPPVLGGVQTTAHALARQLLWQQHEVRVATNRYPRWLPAREVLDEVLVYRWLLLRPDLEQCQRGRPDLFLASFYFYPSTVVRLARLVRNFCPDVVNVHFPDAQVPFVLWLRRHFRFRLVVTLQGHEIERWFADAASAAPQCSDTEATALRDLQLVLREADAVTACSRYLLDRTILLEPSVALKGHVIHNGIDLERFRDPAAHPHASPYFLAYGRLTYKKGFDLLLQAFANIAKLHPDAALIIAGEGEERSDLQDLSHRLGLDGRVEFYGRAAPDEVVRLLNGCRCVVVPSRLEPFGIVGLEALASNKPLVATRVGGLAELLCHQNARLVDPTIQGLTEGLRTAFTETGLPEGARGGNRHLLGEWAWPKVAQRYLQVYAASGV